MHWEKCGQRRSRQDGGGGGGWKEGPKTRQTQRLGVRITELTLFASYFAEQDKTNSV